jgi:helicase
MRIPQRYGDPTINLVLDAIDKNNQSLVFVNTRRSAEAQAEKIAKQRTQRHDDLADKILNVLSNPTKQCKRLAKCVRNGVAFHHSGLHHEQRTIIEDNFKQRTINCICATPTLAMGVDTPAFRVVLRDLKRFGGKGMNWIPVLEYEQMSGRAGRPGFDDYGEAICVAKNSNQEEEIAERYLHGEPEEIVSKLAVEPVLRMYTLSLVASKFCTTTDELYAFFEDTFYATQYQDSRELHAIIDKMIDLLKEWEFVKGETRQKGFVSANELGNASDELEATKIGERVSKLYLDPLTANYLITCMRKATSQNHTEFSWLHMISNTLEMRPQLRVKKSEYEKIRQQSLEHLDAIFDDEPSEFDYDYDRWLNAVKTALFFQDYINEEDEDTLMDEYGIRPGGIYAKKETADWLLYSAQELAKLLHFKPLIKELARMRERVTYGVKRELLPLLKLTNIGRVRARKLYNSGVHDLGDVKEIDLQDLVNILGQNLAKDVKEQVGIDVDDVPEKQKQGQVRLGDF